MNQIACSPFVTTINAGSFTVTTIGGSAVVLVLKWSMARAQGKSTGPGIRHSREGQLAAGFGPGLPTNGPEPGSCRKPRQFRISHCRHRQTEASEWVVRKLVMPVLVVVWALEELGQAMGKHTAPGIPCLQ